MTKTKTPTRQPSVDWATVLGDSEDAAVLNLHRRWASDTGRTALVATHDRQHLEQTRSAAYAAFGASLDVVESEERRALAEVMTEYVDPATALAAAKRLAEASANRVAWRQAYGVLAARPGWASGGAEWSDLLNAARIHDRPRVARWVLKMRSAGRDVLGDQALIERLEAEGRREELNRLVAEENRAERHVHSLGSVA